MAAAHRRRALAALALLALLAAPAAAQQRPIRLLVPVAAGAGADFIARLVADQMAAELGQPIVIENKGGAAGAIAALEVARAQPDGQTLLQCYATTHSTGPALGPLPYDPVTDFAPIGMMATTAYALLVNAALNAQDVAQFIALAKAEPGALAYGSGGSGSSTHLTMAFFAHEAGLQLLQVPYKSSAPALVDLVSGQVQAMFVALASSIPHVRSGKLRALAVAAPTRSALLPEVPTLAKAGYPTLDALQWYGLCAPAGTPAPIVQRLSEALGRALADAPLREKLREQAADAAPMSPERFGQWIRDERARWARMVQSAQLKSEE